MEMTIERVLADNRDAEFVVDDVQWSAAELLRSGGLLADVIVADADGLELLTVSSTNAALVVAGVAAAGHLGVPVLLLDPAGSGSGLGPADDVLLSDNRPGDDSRPVTIGASVECWLTRRRTGSVGCPLPQDSVLFQTSGSTAAPRAVVKPAGAILHDSARIAAALHGRRDASPGVVCAAPVFHSYGFTHGVLAGLMAGARTVFRPPSSAPQSLSKAAARLDAHTLVALPIQIHMIATSRSLTFGGLEQAVSAGAPLRPDAVAGIRRGHAFRLLNVYGASEVGTCAMAAMEERSPAGLIGEPLDGVELRIEPGGGELLVRNDSVATGYLADGEIRPLPIEDGWYRTGDLAERVTGGVRVTGRRGDMINIAGRKTQRSRLEAVLSTHPDVLEVQVIAVEDEFRGEVPAARVVVKPGRERPDILDWSRSRLDAFEVPRHVEWLDRLPRSATGKLIYEAPASTAER
jgi:acyl-coenzyme A synthetase/AMP-(fatty) acid ligase